VDEAATSSEIYPTVLISLLMIEIAIYRWSATTLPVATPE